MNENESQSIVPKNENPDQKPRVQPNKPIKSDVPSYIPPPQPKKHLEPDRTQHKSPTPEPSSDTSSPSVSVGEIPGAIVDAISEVGKSVIDSIANLTKGPTQWERDERKKEGEEQKFVKKARKIKAILPDIGWNLNEAVTQPESGKPVKLVSDLPIPILIGSIIHPDKPVDDAENQLRISAGLRLIRGGYAHTETIRDFMIAAKEMRSFGTIDEEGINRIENVLLKNPKLGTLNLAKIAEKPQLLPDSARVYLGTLVRQWEILIKNIEEYRKIFIEAPYLLPDVYEQVLDVRDRHPNKHALRLGFLAAHVSFTPLNNLKDQQDYANRMAAAEGLSSQYKFSSAIDEIPFVSRWAGDPNLLPPPYKMSLHQKDMENWILGFPPQGISQSYMDYYRSIFAVFGRPAPNKLFRNSERITQLIEPNSQDGEKMDNYIKWVSAVKSAQRGLIPYLTYKAALGLDRQVRISDILKQFHTMNPSDLTKEKKIGDHSTLEFVTIPLPRAERRNETVNKSDFTKALYSIPALGKVLSQMESHIKNAYRKPYEEYSLIKLTQLFDPEYTLETVGRSPSIAERVRDTLVKEGFVSIKGKEWVLNHKKPLYLTAGYLGRMLGITNPNILKSFSEFLHEEVIKDAEGMTASRWNDTGLHKQFIESHDKYKGYSYQDIAAGVRYNTDVVRTTAQKIVLAKRKDPDASVWMIPPDMLRGFETVQYIDTDGKERWAPTIGSRDGQALNAETKYDVEEAVNIIKEMNGSKNRLGNYTYEAKVVRPLIGAIGLAILTNPFDNKTQVHQWDSIHNEYRWTEFSAKNHALDGIYKCLQMLDDATNSSRTSFKWQEIIEVLTNFVRRYENNMDMALGTQSFVPSEQPDFSLDQLPVPVFEPTGQVNIEVSNKYYSGENLETLVENARQGKESNMRIDATKDIGKVIDQKAKNKRASKELKQALGDNQ